MKIIGCLLVIGILLSYAPVFHMDECPGETHSGNIRTDCGGPFHCPIVINIVASKISSLPLNGLLVPTRMLLVVDGSVDPIFHPPEYSGPNFVLRGKRGKNGEVRALAQEFDFFELKHP